MNRETLKVNLIFSGYSCDQIGPYLYFYDNDLGEYKKEYLNKTSFTVEKLSQRYCIGAYDLSKLAYLPCPHKAKLDLNSKINNCTECYNKIGFNPAFYNAQKISPQQLEYNKNPHVVYLAYFSPLCIKVGIASQKRMPKRLLEQGARSAFVLKTFPNAYLARELEAKLCGGGYGILERLTSDQKLTIICEKEYNSNLARKTLADFLMTINITPESDFLEFDSKYFYGNNYDLSDLEKVKNPEFLSGEAIGMIGDVIILNQQEMLIATSVKKFISYEVDLRYGTDFKKYSLEAKQLSLW